jgi:BirA family transcriptional regulator, biotin operon repressor / biotin---[acetyl-CoA-carboxylase] ligase
LSSIQEKRLFNIEVFDIKLETEYLGRNFIYSEEVESTNSLLLDKQNKFNTNGTVLLAERQSKGRGRRERVWYSTKGQNLTFSILLNSKKILKKNLNFINYAAAISVGSAIENRYQIKTDMKWPNDVLVSKKKISGILMESTSLGSNLERLVIGVGINVNQTAFQGQYRIEPTSIYTETGESADRETLLAEFLNIFEAVLNKLETEPEEILREWKNRCSMIGERISIEDNGKIRSGIFDDIDNNGYLLFKSAGKIETIHFGDVSLI